ncbi:MAG: DNA cytosine methyltransferase [Paludibacteraceae bacterium]|nr:DNA cytosine methyltransferase [Paludibacteraceae bacterium]
MPDCDLILGGSPCQDFSIIWEQPGLNGGRGNSILTLNQLSKHHSREPDLLGEAFLS